MKVLLTSGKVLWFVDAVATQERDDDLILFAKRKHEIGRVKVPAITAYWYDCENVVIPE